MKRRLAVLLLASVALIGCQKKVTPATTTPPEITNANMKAQLSGHTVNLTWNWSGAFVYYSVYRSLTSGSGYVRRAEPRVPLYSDASTFSGKTYYYVVTVTTKKNGVNVESGYSNEQKATIP